MQTDCFPYATPEWPKALISELAEVNPRYRLTKGGKYPFIEMAAVGENFGGIQGIDFRRFEGSGLSRFQVGDTLFAKITPCPENGKIAYVAELPAEFGIGSTEFIVLSPHASCNPKFLFHLLCCHEVRSRAITRMEGSTGRQRIPDDVFNKRLVVPVPPPEEQAAIAHILDTVDTVIAQTQKAAEQAKMLDHSLLHDLLENGLDRPRSGQIKLQVNWEICRVDDVAEVGSGVTLGRDVSGYKTVELPYLRVANVQDGRLDLSEIKNIRVPIHEVERYRLEVGDVVMTEGGDIDKLGRGTIWEGQLSDCLHQNHVFRVRANQQKLEPFYLAFIIESDIAKRYFFRVAKRTTNLASINKTQLRAFRFPLPPLPEQRKIVEVVQAAKAKTNALMAKKAALEELKKSLMYDLLTGAVRTTDLGMDFILRKES